MNTQSFDTITRQAAGTVSRRASLLTLGGAALAAAATQSGIGEAKKKKKGMDCKKKEKQRCSNDAAACINTLLATGDCDAECLATLTPCCEACSSNGFLTCFLATL